MLKKFKSTSKITKLSLLIILIKQLRFLDSYNWYQKIML